MIHDEICTYEVCKLAKEKGFNIPTIGYYLINKGGWYKTAIYNDWNYSTIRYSAPTQSLLQRWLREEKGIHIGIGTDGGNDWCYITVVIATGHTEYNTNIFPTYELALEDALKYTLEKLV